jgi:uncharacterized membrane protein YraQ (UPF0718 family)
VGTLGDDVNLFACCIFTLNAFTIVLPAFLLAGALVVFVPSYSVMKYLGAKANRIVSYGVAAVSGNVLTVCSCNVVPIFAGILRRGAGIGPAFCFVFAAPAIHIVNTAFTYQVIGPKLALWRFFMVPVIAIVLGLVMSVLFRREEQERQCEVSNSSVALVDASPEQTRRGELFLGLLVGVLIFGAWMPLDGNLPGAFGQYVRLAGVILAVALLVPLAVRWFGREESYEWGRQTWLLLRMIVPIFLVAVVAIAVIVQRIPISWVMPTAAEQGGLKFGHPQGNSLPAVFVAAVFSTLMYFPMLTEVAFTKGLLLHYFALGPALALLLGGPGLSLPGLLLVSKVAGFRKMVVYWVLMVTLITIVAFAFGSYFGEYECSCQRQGPGSEALADAPPLVGWSGLAWYGVLMAWIAVMLAKAGRGQRRDDAIEETSA